MNLCRIMKGKLAGGATILATLLSLTGCTSPLWWHDPDRGFLYKGWYVNIVDQATAIRECDKGPTVMGCVKPASMTAYSVNNPYILAHECRHIDHITDGAGARGEQLADLFYSLSGMNDLLVAATNLLPAPTGCGSGTMAVWQNNRFEIVQRTYGRSQILPTIEEWNRSFPDRAMADPRFVAAAE